MKISEKIEHIRKLLKDSETFPAVSEEYLYQTESELGIIFPEEFRIFYTQISDGAEFGSLFMGHHRNSLNSLTKIRQSLESQREYYNSVLHYADSDLLHHKFELDGEHIWHEEGSYEPHLEADYGNIQISNIGCGQEWKLIVNGNFYGTVWYSCEWGIEPCKPYLGFMDWFIKLAQCNDDMRTLGY